MPIPDYQKIMLPVLTLASDGAEHKISDSIEYLAQHFGISDKERAELLPSGTQTVFNNRCGWARSYLKQAGLLTSSKRGFFEITQRGLDLLRSKPTYIDAAILEQYPEFLAFKKRKSTKGDINAEPQSNLSAQSALTPEDSLASAYRQLRAEIESEILSLIKDGSPSFFEKLVVDLLVKMGYGGNRQDAGKALGKSGDGGIDGIINEDKLGLDVIYLQAKRWEGTVGRPEIQKFAGALQGQRAKKGVFITTSDFSKEARDYASLIDTRIILINGEMLARLMTDHNVGVSTAGIYELKKIDSDYFENE